MGLLFRYGISGSTSFATRIPTVNIILFNYVHPRIFLSLSFNVVSTLCALAIMLALIFI